MATLDGAEIISSGHELQGAAAWCGTRQSRADSVAGDGVTGRPLAAGQATIVGMAESGSRVPSRASHGDVVRSPHADALFSAHQYQGSTNDCGPFVTAMIVNSLTGAKLDGARLARQMDRPSWNRIVPRVRRIPRWATFPWGLTEILIRHGLRARWRVLAREQDLLAALTAGRVAVPIIGGWRPPWAHYSALVLHDPRKGWAFADPQTRVGAVVWRTHEVFAHQWSMMGRILVEAEPRQ